MGKCSKKAFGSGLLGAQEFCALHHYGVVFWERSFSWLLLFLRSLFPQTFPIQLDHEIGRFLKGASWVPFSSYLLFNSVSSVEPHSSFTSLNRVVLQMSISGSGFSLTPIVNSQLDISAGRAPVYLMLRCPQAHSSSRPAYCHERHHQPFLVRPWSPPWPSCFLRVSYGLLRHYQKCTLKFKILKLAFKPPHSVSFPGSSIFIPERLPRHSVFQSHSPVFTSSKVPSSFCHLGTVRAFFALSLSAPSRPQLASPPRSWRWKLFPWGNQELPLQKRLFVPP